MKVEVVVFAVCVAACIAAHVAILRSVVRSRAVASDPGVPRPRLLVEIAWALVPAVALAFVLTATWAKVQEHTDAPKPTLLMRVAR
jgi:heme/copper-type cytochrome/quinol oxidase subunit 2